MIKNGAVPILIKYLEQEKNEQVLEQAIWALGNMIADSEQNRDLIVNQGILNHLYKILNQGVNITLHSRIFTTLSKVLRFQTKLDLILLIPFVSLFKQFINNSNEILVVEVLWCISYFTIGTNDRIQIILDAGLWKPLIQFLYSKNDLIQTPALRSIGNIVTGTIVQTRLVLDHGVLYALKNLLTHKKKSIRVEACWTISNILGDDAVQININSGIFPEAIQIFKNDDIEVKKQALHIFSSPLTLGFATEKIKLYFLSLGILDVFFQKFEDNFSTQTSLNGLDCLLEV